MGPKASIFMRQLETHGERTVHRAECEDGMPPESTKAVRSHTPVL